MLSSAEHPDAPTWLKPHHYIQRLGKGSGCHCFVNPASPGQERTGTLGCSQGITLFHFLTTSHSLGFYVPKSAAVTVLRAGGCVSLLYLGTNFLRSTAREFAFLHICRYQLHRNKILDVSSLQEHSSQPPTSPRTKIPT